MSHFSVMVITDREPNEDMLAMLMQPYHEFECTGIDDRYVQSIDRTDEARAQYEKQRNEEPPVTESFREWVAGWYGIHEVQQPESPDVQGKHKYGHVLIGADGSVVQVIDRTNPNKKWDYWRVGGRYRSKLQVKDGVTSAVSSDPSYEWEGHDIPEGFDSACVADIDFDKMKLAAQQQREAVVGKCVANCGLSREAVEAACKLQKESHAKWMELTERPRGADYFQWLRDSGYGILADAYKGNFELPETDGQSLDEWIAAAPALTAFAVVNSDGQWYEQGRMGWWGIVTNEDDSWDKRFNELLASLQPTQWITFLDCHI